MFINLYAIIPSVIDKIYSGIFTQIFNSASKSHSSSGAGVGVAVAATGGAL